MQLKDNLFTPSEMGTDGLKATTPASRLESNALHSGSNIEDNIPDESERFDTEPRNDEETQNRHSSHTKSLTHCR